MGDKKDYVLAYLNGNRITAQDKIMPKANDTL